VLELLSTRASVLGCFASSEALDRMPSSFRVAPDEAMIVGKPSDPQTASVTERLGEDALVLDMTDGWAIWTLAGDGAREAFTYLSPVQLTDGGFTSGDVARMPVRIVSRSDRIHLLVPAMWRNYLRERILHDCASLDVRERAEPVDWEADG
jgi:hypothetical protein